MQSPDSVNAATVAVTAVPHFLPQPVLHWGYASYASYAISEHIYAHLRRRTRTDRSPRSPHSSGSQVYPAQLLIARSYAGFLLCQSLMDAVIPSLSARKP